MKPSQVAMMARIKAQRTSQSPREYRPAVFPQSVLTLSWLQLAGKTRRVSRRKTPDIIYIKTSHCTVDCRQPAMICRLPHSL